MEKLTYLHAQVQINKPGNLPDPSLDSASVQSILNYAFSILFLISVLMITLQGVRYALSQGESDKTAQARKGIIYALVGVVIAVMGVTLTEFALSNLIPEDTSNIPSLLEKIISAIALLTGIISTIMIVIGGYRYVLSSGDGQKTSQARNTIIYALVGAVVAGAGGPIALFVLGRIG